MNIRLMPRVEDIFPEIIEGSNAIVIDVLRATSVITTAINNGAAAVIPVLSIDEAFEARDKCEKAVLGGERKGLKIEGFDMGNSPLECTKEFIEDRTLVMTTSNGTRAIKGCSGAKNIIIGSLLNSPAAAKAAAEDDTDISIVCAGTLGNFSLDDFICAGYIIDEVLKIMPYGLDDISFLAHYTYVNNKDDIEGFMKNACHYNYLVSIGLGDDVKYCCQTGVIDVVPEYKDGAITLR